MDQRYMSLSEVPTDATKKIQAGKLKGKVERTVKPGLQKPWKPWRSIKKHVRRLTEGWRNYEDK